MPTCPRCNEFITVVAFADGDCPRCQAEQQQADSSQSGQWRSAAKVTNLAEAGYLVSRLADEGIDARLVTTESFSAVHGNWSSVYVLQVPAGSFDVAAEILHSEVEEIRQEEPDYDADGEPIEEEPVHLVFWRPVALMAVAGLATLWLGQRAADPRPRVAPNRTAAALGSAIETVGKPFVVRGDRGRVEHRLRYRSANRTWYLESDTDGDGILDRQQRFRLEVRDQ